MNIMMHNTNVRLPRAPTVRPMIDINKFSVGHDFANLNTRNYSPTGKWMKRNENVENLEHRIEGCVGDPMAIEGISE